MGPPPPSMQLDIKLNNCTRILARRHGDPGFGLPPLLHWKITKGHQILLIPVKKMSSIFFSISYEKGYQFSKARPLLLKSCLLDSNADILHLLLSIVKLNFLWVCITILTFISIIQGKFWGWPFLCQNWQISPMKLTLGSSNHPQWFQNLQE